MKISYLSSRMQTLPTLFFLYVKVCRTVTLCGPLNIVISYCHTLSCIFCFIVFCAYALWVTAIIIIIIITKRSDIAEN